MKLKYEAIKQNRVNHNFMGFTTYENGWWFNKDKWEQNAKAGCNSYQDCRTVKAFRRKLKSAPKGVEFVLVSRWAGRDVIGVGGIIKTKIN